MKKILLLYFSAAGATKKVAGFIKNYLSRNYMKDVSVDIFSVEEITLTDFNLRDYDALVVGTPVYHAAPARLVMNYFKDADPIERPMPVFIFNTMGLFAGNANRMLAKHLRSKNIFCVMDRQYRAPASDASLLLPHIKRFFKFEKNTRGKIISDCDLFLKILRQGTPEENKPGFNWGSLVNAPNRWAGRMLKFKIYLNRENCLKCGKCVRDCPHKVLKMNEESYPLPTKKNCENCYRCVHNCPGKALSLTDKSCSMPEKNTNR